MLNHFKIDKARDTLYPAIQCFQIPLMGVVQEALDDGVLEDLLPSWAKFAADPLKSKGFFVYMLQSIFMGKTNSIELNIDYQVSRLGKMSTDRRVAMMFLPANTKVENLNSITKIARESLPSVEVILLSGQTTSNRKAEKYVTEFMEKNPNASILIIAAQMAQRSFSIPEITELYLAYDNGSNGATTQKMSRTLTPSDQNKIGRIFSLSFDPNRDDKFDALILGAALAIREKGKEKDIKAALKKVLRSVDIFKTTENGPIKFDPAEYIAECLDRNSVSRVLGKVADVSKITMDMRKKLANGSISVSQLEKLAVATKGKTYDMSGIIKSAKNTSDKDMSETELAKVRAMITTIIENIDYIIYGTETDNILEGLKIVREWGEEAEIEAEFGVPFDVIEFLFEHQIVNQDMVNIKLEFAG
jgi:hypothetical protein